MVFLAQMLAKDCNFSENTHPPHALSHWVGRIFLKKRRLQGHLKQLNLEQDPGYNTGNKIVYNKIKCLFTITIYLHIISYHIYIYIYIYI